jgi:eukaryotic-like serine/threonine-protein kinase
MATNTLQKPLRSVGNWDLVERIADSGMGTVYKAQNRVSGEVAAVKVLPPFQAGKEQAYQRFARECRILSALKDPHIVRASDFGIEGCDPYLVMEFVEGETLGERIKREGRIPEAEAVRLIVQVAGALGRAHARGLIHRNVKPDSIMIAAGGQAKLTDLCLIKEVDPQEALTRDGTSLGTPNFMAPEQFVNAAKATRAGDVYSLGATLYMAVTGAPPFGVCHQLEMCVKKVKNDLLPPRQLVPTLSERIDRTIRRAMSAQPDHRPASCEEFVESLTTGSASETVAATADDAHDQTARESPGLPVPHAAGRGVARVGAAAEIATPANSAAATVPPVKKSDRASSEWLWCAAIALVAAFVAGFFLLSRLAH